MLDDLSALFSDAQALAGAVESTADVAGLRSEGRRVGTQARTLRTQLDALTLSPAEGQEQLEVALWDRETRRALLQVEASGVALSAALRDVEPGGYQQRRYVVGQGDTLQSIARKLLGDWQLWTQIVAANGLDPGADLAVGTVLIIPEGAP